MDRKYAAFISYRHARLDSAVAKALHSLIEQYRIPRDLRPGGQKKIGIVFRDQEELHAASDLSAEITYALENAQFLIVICSENTVHSPWVSREIESFLTTHDRSHIFTVLASGEPAEVFPRQLTHIVNAQDGSVQVIEPLAVDVRANSISGMRRKLRREIPRLISAMLDCPYDALVMREQKRKTRRILTAAAAVMAVLLGFSSMLFVKNQQIEQRNEELARQKAEVQLRESQLLTQDARDALDNGDYRTAIENAVAALPKEGEEGRPYYAPAEGILMEAMNIFGDEESPVILNTTDLTQMTEISEFRISQDGRRVVTVDSYGTVRCFSPDSGSELWSHTVSAAEEAYPSDHQNLLLRRDESILCYYCGRLEAFDLQTGTLLWSRDLPGYLGNYMFYHDGQDVLVFLEHSQDADAAQQLYLTVLSGKTGELLQTIPLVFEEEDVYASINPYMSEYFALGGTFSEDGSLFAGAYTDGSYMLHCFVADLTRGTGEFCLNTAPGPFNTTVTGMDLRKENGTLLITAHNLKESNCASALLLDVRTGDILWQTDISGDPGSFSFVRDISYVHFLEKYLLLGFYDQIHCIDRETGSILSRKQVDGILSFLGHVSDNSFGYAMENGTYGLGWLSKDGTVTLSTGADYQIAATVAPHRTLQVWGGGIVQRVTGSVFELSVSNVAAPGYVAVIPEDMNNSVQIVRPVRLSSAVSRNHVEIPGKILYASSGCTALHAYGKVILGPLQETDPETYDHREIYLVLDDSTGKILHIWRPEESIRPDQIFWLPETLSRVNCNTYGDITLTNWYGVTTQLSPTDDGFIVNDNGWIFVSHMIRSASAYQETDQTLLTARTYLDSITLWRNGENPETIPLPEQVSCTPEGCSNLSRFIKVGTNGYVLVSCHPEDHPAEWDAVAVLDAGSGAWLTLDGEWSIPSISAVTFAREKQLLAILDGSQTMRLFNLSNGTQTVTFPAQVPADAVAQMDFLLEDTCLMLKTHEGQILIFDAATGAVLYRDQVDSSYGGTFRTYVDKANQRLYIACGVYTSRPDGICVDLPSWTRLSYLEGLLYFDEEQGLLYQTIYSGSQRCCVYTLIPGTSELVELGAGMIG